MRKHLKLISIFTLAAVFVVLGLHFVPFDSRSGYLDYGGANVCIGYMKPVDYQYRWITGGVNAWDDQLSHLKETKLVPPYSSRACDQPAHVRLYLL